jgi:CheY-like chemotaxis protein
MADATQKKEELVFCPGCGEDVGTYDVKREGVVEVRCNFCGLTLESAVFETEVKGSKECIMFVEDSELIRMMLDDALVENKAAKKVITANNGFEFMEKLIDRFINRLPVDLIILDIQMPIMSGINAAVALRAIENGFKREGRRIPVIFFSVKKCDDTLKKVMEFCAPAQYVNKGVSNTKDELFSRVKQVINQMMV